MPIPVPKEVAPFTAEPGEAFRLAELDPGFVTPEFDKKKARKRIADNARKMHDLAARLYAENRRSILLILQGMDTSGKDGTIRTVLRGINPQSCLIKPFKAPTEEELAHDFLWRIHKVVPRKGHIGIFNRSHYEDVLVVRVRELAAERVWQRRYRHINHFERLLAESGTTLVKCFLYISRDEQRKRLQARIDNPQNHWKFDLGDLDDREHWDDYIQAYEEALTRCNTRRAPWYVVPANRKWYRSLVVSELLLFTLRRMNPQYPPPNPDLEGLEVP